VLDPTGAAVQTGAALEYLAQIELSEDEFSESRRRACVALNVAKLSASIAA
jgi:hypothetical protein